MSADMQKALKELGWSMDQYARTKDLYDEYMNGSSQIVSLMDRFYTELLSNGGAYEQTMHWSMVAVDPSNRDREGLAVDRVARTPSVVKKAGFSHRICDQDSCAREENPITHEVAKFMTKLTAMSDRYATYKESEIKLGSLGASHLNHSFAAADQGVSCNDSLISEGGRMSRAKLEQDSMYKQAFSKGLNWKIIRYQVIVLFPNTTHLFQAALNSSSQAAAGLNTI